MKKSIIIGVLIVGLITISIGLAAAQNGQGKGYDSADFVDVDGDGVCDNLGNCINFVDEDGDGICDNIGKNGRDDDGDGTPNGQDDDYSKNPRDGRGNHGQGQGYGYGYGRNR
jgi:hypothetical protein